MKRRELLDEAVRRKLRGMRHSVFMKDFLAAHPELRERQGKTMRTGLTPEVIARRSAAIRAAYDNPELLRRVSEKSKAAWAARRRLKTEMLRYTGRQRLIHRERWTRTAPEKRVQSTAAWIVAGQKAAREKRLLQPTRGERALMRVFDLLPFPYEREFQIGPYFADFYLPTRKWIVECDGFSHRNPEAQAADHKRDAFIRTAGYTVVRLEEKELLYDPARTVFKTIFEGVPV